VPLGQGLDSRTRSSVASEGSEDVELDTRVVGSVEAGTRSTTAQLCGSRALNLEVDALGVGLGAVGLARSVQRDDFVANDVVTRGNIGEGQVPGEVVGNQVIGSPLTGVAARLPGLGRNLGPLQARRVDGTAVAVARRNVLLNRADVADGPGIPLESDLAAGLDGYVGTVALALLVADNGRGAKGIRRDEAVVEVVGLPANGGRNGVLVLESSVPALVFLAIGDDLVNVAVSCHKGRKKDEEGEHDGNVMRIVSNNPEKRRECVCDCGSCW
jgi:hypothetical protein